MVIDEARAILHESETRLRAILGNAASAGDYEAVLQITRWAQALAAMNSDTPRRLCDGAVVDAPGAEFRPSGPCEKTAGTLGDGSRGASCKTRTGGRPKAREKRIRPSSYPKFFRWKGCVVKVGWSKRDAKEYHHKAPRRVLDCLVDRVLVLGETGSMFTSDDVLPLCDPSDNGEFATYQVYVCLAWLRHEGLLLKEGRQGYRLCDASQIREKVAKCWEQLPIQR